MRNCLLLILLGFCALSGCGGGGSPSVSLSSPTSPNVSLSANGLTFGDEIVGTTSQPLLITLTNTGTATLTITSIVASANFVEADNCGSTLAAGANCTVNVTLTPTTTGSLSGTLSFTDNAAGTPQAISLNGTGTAGTTTDTLTGYCFGAGPADMCRNSQDLTQCPVGQAAISPQTVVGCLPPASALVDTSTACGFKMDGRETFSGSCVVQATAETGSCSVQGQQCGAAELPPFAPDSYAPPHQFVRSANQRQGKLPAGHAHHGAGVSRIGSDSSSDPAPVAGIAGPVSWRNQAITLKTPSRGQ